MNLPLVLWARICEPATHFLGTRILTTLTFSTHPAALSALPQHLPSPLNRTVLPVPLSTGALSGCETSSFTINVTAARLFCPDLIFFHLPLTGHRTNSNKNKHQRRLIYWTRCETLQVLTVRTRELVCGRFQVWKPSVCI